MHRVSSTHRWVEKKSNCDVKKINKTPMLLKGPSDIWSPLISIRSWVANGRTMRIPSPMAAALMVKLASLSRDDHRNRFSLSGHPAKLCWRGCPFSEVSELCCARLILPWFGYVSYELSMKLFSCVHFRYR